FPDFGHIPEGTDLTVDNAGNAIPGLLPPIPTNTFHIPTPPVSAITNFPNPGDYEPTARYNVINTNPAEEMMTMLNGIIDSMSYENNAQGNLGDLTAAQS